MATIHQQKKRKTLKRILACLFFFILFAFVLFLIFSPSIARNYINKHGKELTGRSLHVDKLKVNYFSSTLRAYGGKMFEQDSSEVFVGFDSLLVNLRPLRILKNEIDIQEFRIVNLKASFIQNDTVFNYSDLIDFYSSEEEAAEDTTPSSTSYIFNLNNLEIKKSTVLYTDKQLDNTIAMRDFGFFIPHISWGGEDKSRAGVSFRLAKGGSFHGMFDYNTETGDYSGTADLNNFNLGVALPYVKQFVNFSDIDGAFSAKIEFSGNQSDLTKFTLKGNSTVDSLSITDPDGKKVLGLKNVKAEFKEIKPMQNKVKLGTLKFEQPYAYFALIDSLSNFEKMLVAEDDGMTENSTAVAESEEEKYDISIDSLLINDGIVDFCDQRFNEPFFYGLSDIKINMDSISLDSNWLKLVAKMKLNKRGKLEGTLGINPFNPFQHVELNYILSDFQLPDINVYSKHYAGLPILFGDMYYVGKTSILDHKLNSNNELLIRNVELGRKVGGLYDMPIKLALFILKDKNGDIDLDIPVTGDLSDPRTRIGHIVWNTFKGFFVKVATSPFRALGNLLDADPEELKEVTFSYSDTTLTNKQEHSLDLLLKLEQVKPGLQVEMQYVNDPKLERFDAAAQIMQQTYEQKTHKSIELGKKGYLKFLQNESGKDSLLLQDYERILAPAAKVDSIIAEREQIRLDMVKAYLKSKNDSTGIIVSEFNKEEVLNIGSRPRFTISYNLAEDNDVINQEKNDN